MTVRANAMTVDVEDWFNATILQCSGLQTPPTPAVERNTNELLEVFEAHGVKATWFFLGEVAESYPHLVRSIVDAGHEPGIHGFHHHQVSALTKRALRSALRRAKDTVEQAGGAEARGYRAVDFGVSGDTMYVFDILLDLGFSYDSSLFPFSGPRYGSTGTPLGLHPVHRDTGSIWEIPVTVGNILGLRFPAAGGGYFRHFPLWYTSLVICTAHAARRPAVFYLHPCEIEDNPELPGLPEALTEVDREAVESCFRSQSKHRSRGKAKLHRLFRKHRFDTVAHTFDLDRRPPPHSPAVDTAHDEATS